MAACENNFNCSENLRKKDVNIYQTVDAIRARSSLVYNKHLICAMHINAAVGGSLCCVILCVMVSLWGEAYELCDSRNSALTFLV